jgi:hypothetical protein
VSGRVRAASLKATNPVFEETLAVRYVELVDVRELPPLSGDRQRTDRRAWVALTTTALGIAAGP